MAWLADSYFDSDLDLSWLRNGVFLQDPGDPNFDLQIENVQELKIKQVFNEANSKTTFSILFSILLKHFFKSNMHDFLMPLFGY